MKKILLSVTLVASTLLSFAQTPQVPNGNFETWAIFSGCSSTDSAAHFSTLDEEFSHDLKKCIPVASVTKSTSSHSGTYALKMIPAAIYNPQTSATTYYGTTVSSADVVYGSNIAFNGRPTKLKGYCNLTIAGTDTFGISVGTLIKGAVYFLAYGDLTLKTSTTGYQAFEITLTYDAAVSANPDSLFLSFALGNSNGQASPSSMVLIDDLSFDYGTTTATTNYTSGSLINVYAANKNINFSENVSDVHIVDMVGAEKMTETATTKILNAGSLTNGMYIVTYKYNDAYFSKKIVIE